MFRVVQKFLETRLFSQWRTETLNTAFFTLESPILTEKISCESGDTDSTNASSGSQANALSAETDAVPPGFERLPYGKPLETIIVISKLRSVCGELPKQIPPGRKDNVFIIINNADNLTNRAAGRHSNFTDDCGIWRSVSGSTATVPYLIDDRGEIVRRLFFRNSQYKIQKKVSNQYVYVASVTASSSSPQPDLSEIL
jgi:hypothetical protein